MNAGILSVLAWRFLVMAFLAIGGANALIPEMHRQAVEVDRWMTDGEFAAYFAIASSAPGPNVLIVTLIGWHVAGTLGAFVTTAAMIGPTSILTFVVFRLWDRFRDAPWRRPVQNGLSTVTIGLVAASGYLLARAADTGLVTLAITLAAAAISYRTKLNPLWSFAAAAAIGAAGWT